MAKKLGYAPYRIAPLKKITSEAKRIREQNPRKSWKSAIKEAGKKYRLGAIKPERKMGARPHKKKTAKKRTSVVAVRKSTTTRVRASRIGRRSPVRRHRMAGEGGGNGLKKLLPVALMVGAGLLLWKALSPKPATVPPGAPPLIQTSNPVRNQQTSDIVQYAVAGGLAIDAIIKLIQSLNQRSDSEVQRIYDELDQGGDLPATLFV